MRARDVDAAVSEATRAERAALESPGLDEARRELLAAIVAEPQAHREPAPASAPRHWFGARRSRRRYLSPGTAVVLAATVAGIVLGTGVGPSGSPPPAEGVGLARLVRSSPHLLLGARRWAIVAASQVEAKRGLILFWGSVGRSNSYLGGRLKVSFQASAELEWHTTSAQQSVQAPGHAFVPVAAALTLGTTARVFARRVPDYRGREYVAAWVQDGRYLQLRSFAPNLTSFEHRLASLHLVSSGAWLQALPTHMVVQNALTYRGMPVERQFSFACGRQLPPRLAARTDNPRVARFLRQCSR